MRNCAFCRNPLKPMAEWKGADGRFYCNEFCADAGDAPVVHVLPKQSDNVAYVEKP